VSTSQEHDLAQALVDLSDTLVADFDVMDFLHGLAGRCVELLGMEAAGIMIADQRGALRVMASSSEQARLLELFEVESDEGPCVDCYAGGAPVADPDLDTPDPRWRRFADRARRAGFRAVHAVRCSCGTRSSACSTCSPPRPARCATRMPARPARWPT
jgi:hypothetical protein